MTQTLSLISMVLVFIGTFRYLWSIYQGNQPEKISWCIWVCIDCILAYQMYAAGTLNLQMSATVAMTTIIALYALARGKPGWTWYDIASVAGSVFGVYLWFKLESVTIGILMSGLVMLIGSVPICIAAWENPKREDIVSWLIFFASTIAQLLATPEWSLDYIVQPITFFVVQSTLISIITWRSLSHRQRYA